MPCHLVFVSVNKSPGIVCISVVCFCAVSVGKLAGMLFDLYDVIAELSAHDATAKFLTDTW